MSRIGSRPRCPYLFDGKIRTSDFTHFSGLEGIVERFHCFRYWRIRVRAMDLVKVDRIDLKAPQTSVDGFPDIAWICASVRFAQLHPELRRNDRLTAAALEGSAQKLLALPRAVNVGCVEEIDPCIESSINHRCRSCGIGSPTEVVAPDSNER